VTSIIDTHAHLDLADFATDRGDVLRRALDAGVHAIVLIGFNPKRWRSTAALCDEYPWLRRTVGIHPNEAELWSPAVAVKLEREIADTQPLAVGEIGLDFYRDSADVTSQRRAFDAQIGIARAADLPIAIHQRAAEDEVLAALVPLGPVRGIMHCFSGDASFADRCIELGLHLGVGGVATFPKSSAVREALVRVPMERIVVETDAPYLAPQPWRGRRNEPAYLAAVLEMLATLRSMSVAEVAKQTSENAVALFGETLELARSRGAEAAKCT
jgi:TatD DNase family protein